MVVVNETMGPREDSIGRTIDLDDGRWQVIGVVADMRPALPLMGTLPAVYRPITPAGYTTPSSHGSRCW